MTHKYHAKGAGPMVLCKNGKLRPKYPSKRQAVRAYELQLLEKAGLISNLREEVKYVLIPKQEGEREVGYIADFVYEEGGQLVVEDSKGFRTPEYIIKRKLMQYRFGIKVREV